MSRRLRRTAPNTWQSDDPGNHLSGGGMGIECDVGKEDSRSARPASDVALAGANSTVRIRFRVRWIVRKIGTKERVVGNSAESK